MIYASIIFIKHQAGCFISVLWQYTNPKVYKERIFNARLLLFQWFVTVFTDVMFITAFLMFLYDLFKMSAMVWIVAGMHTNTAAVEQDPSLKGPSLCTGVKSIRMLLACLSAHLVISVHFPSRILPGITKFGIWLPIYLKFSAVRPAAIRSLVCGVY